ncbi:phospholipid carrier-dependent glycosyltransferase [Candidatus Dependentiae bacterium]|nr:phospholipid carrier-dependent glycosyltransferase [Candidatus Dependentiae bacterium]
MGEFLLDHKQILVIFSFTFIFFSFLLYKNVSFINSHQDIDSKAYLNNAITFHKYNNFVQSGQALDIPYYSMGYAFFIGILYKIFGINNWVLIFVQILLALLTGFLIFRIANYLFDKNTAIISFILFSINLGFLVFSQFILTEILLSFFLVLFLERFVLFLRTNLILYLIESAFCLGLSIAIKPAALYFIFFIILFLLVFAKNRIKSVIIFSLFFYLPILGYMSFNKITYNQFVVGALGNENLYFYFLPKVLACKNNSSIKKELLHIQSLLNGNKLESKSWKKINQLWMQTLKQNPFLCFKIWLLNVLKTFLGLFTTNLKVLVEPTTKGGDVSFFKTKGDFLCRIMTYISAGTCSCIVRVVGFFELVWNVLRYLFCLIAFGSLILNKRWEVFFLLSFFIFYFAFITGHDGCARFRMMFEFILIILAARGIIISWKISKGS